jgi:hypothetical protein
VAAKVPRCLIREAHSLRRCSTSLVRPIVLLVGLTTTFDIHTTIAESPQRVTAGLDTTNS